MFNISDNKKSSPPLSNQPTPQYKQNILNPPKKPEKKWANFTSSTSKAYFGAVGRINTNSGLAKIGTNHEITKTSGSLIPKKETNFNYGSFVGGQNDDGFVHSSPELVHKAQTRRLESSPTEKPFQISIQGSPEIKKPWMVGSSNILKEIDNNKLNAQKSSFSNSILLSRNMENCSGFAESMVQPEQKLKSMYESSIDRANISQIVRQRLEQNRANLLIEEDDKDYIRRVKQAFSNREGTPLANNWEGGSGKGSPLSNQKYTGCSAVSNFIKGLVSSKSLSKDKKNPSKISERKASRNLDFGNHANQGNNEKQQKEVQEEEKRSISPPSVQKNCPKSSNNAATKVNHSSNKDKGKKSKIKLFINTLQNKDNFKALLNAGKSRPSATPHEALKKKFDQRSCVTEENQKLSRLAIVNQQKHFEPSRLQNLALSPRTQTTSPNTRPVKKFIETEGAADGRVQEKRTTSYKNNQKDHKSNRQSSKDGPNGIPTKQKDSTKTQTAPNSHFEEIMEKTLSNKTLKRRSIKGFGNNTSSIENSQTLKRPSKGEDQSSVDIEAATFYFILNEASDRGYTRPTDIQMSSFRVVTKVIGTVIGKLRSNQDYYDDLREYVDVCQVPVFSLFEVVSIQPAHID